MLPLILSTLVLAQAPHGQDRTALTSGDPDRSIVTVWTAVGDTKPFRVDSYTWTAPDGTTYPAPRVQLPRTAGNGWPLQFYGSARLPDGATTKPGRWTLDCGRGPEFSFAVAPAPPAPLTVSLTPNSPPAQVSAALAKGRNVHLQPGLYEWATPCYLPTCTGLRVTGVGATIRSSAATVFDRQGGTALVQDLTVDGLTIEGTDGAQGTAFMWLPGLVAKNCALRRVNFGGTHATATVKDCLFDHAGMTRAPVGLGYRCRFVGGGGQTSWPPHAYALAYAPGQDGAGVALVDCVFEDTDRGPTFDTNWGPTLDGLFVGTKLANIAGEENGSESFLAEGPGEFSRNLIFTTRAHGCRGSCVQFMSPARDNLVWDMQTDAPTHLWDDNTGNRFADCEWDSYIEFGPKAKNNTVSNSGVRFFAPRRLNQDGYAPWMYTQPFRSYAVRADAWDGNGNLRPAGPNAATNTFTGGFIATGPGTAAVLGASAVNVKVSDATSAQPAAGKP